MVIREYPEEIILIESQWNLKLLTWWVGQMNKYINRITVEFKGKFIYRYINTNTILIESQ